MRPFNYSKIKEEKWNSEILGLIAAIYKFAGKQELYLKQRPDELEKLVEIAKIQSIEASNAIEGIVTTNTRIKQLVEEKTTPKNGDEEEIAGYRDVLNIIHESFDTIPITQNYILHELEFIETRRYTINNSSLHKTHGTVNMLNLVDGKSAVIEGDFESFIVHYAETFIIPASIKEYSIKPYGCDEVKVLKAYVRS